ncbi:MAG: folate family ECF transporter S component [Blautia sp.]|nr:folate family ECF transporter S component [Blautia sp.]
MEKKSFWSVRTMVFLALLTAVQIVLTRVFVIELGGVYRISLGSVATILAGLWFGPVAGGLCGFAGDLLGCFMRGYTINPLITLAAICWGVLPALVRPLSANKSRKVKTVYISAAIAVTAVISSLILTTAGLVLLNGANFYAIFPGRVVQCLILTPIYCVVTCLLYFSPLTIMVSEDMVQSRVADKTAS